jgi:hypothetical protein
LRKESAADFAKRVFPFACQQLGLPVPVEEHEFAAPDRKWRIDFAWPDRKVGLECDGGVWTGGRHTRGSGWVKDTEKLNDAACRGWRMLRTTPDKLNAAETFQWLRRALAA